MATRRAVFLSGAIAAAVVITGGCARSGGQTGPPAHGQTQARTDKAEGYRAFLALANAGEVVRIDVADGDGGRPGVRVTPAGADNAGEGVAVAPAAGKLYVAETGQYDVLAVDTVTGKRTRIEVGPFPQDVAVAPSGRTAYATVSGSDVVAVIDTESGTVRADITAGPAPRQVVFGPDGTRAYVSTERGIDVIDVATSSVIRVIPDPLGPQGLAVSADGRTLYVTNPGSGTLWKLDPATGALLASTITGSEPYAVTVAGSSVYTADMDADAVSVVSPVSGRVTGTIGVGRLPMSIAATPDGAQIWVGNGLSGTVSVISAASRQVIATIRAAAGNTNPLGIAFAAPG
jgi:YVTN family beta-propeller protein